MELQIAAILALSALIFSLAGFGFGLISVPLLALAMPIQEAVALQFPVSMLLVVYNTWRYRHDFNWRSIVPLMFGALVAMPLGMLSLQHFSASFMKTALAVFIVAAVINGRLEIGRRWASRWAATPAMGVVMGVVSGWFGGAYTTGGPPAVIYAMAATKDPQETKGVLAAYFALTDVVVMAMYFWSGLMTWPVLGRSLAFSPAVVLGMVVGFALARRIGAGVYRLAADALLMVSAALLWRSA
ncbi:protein of unknown function DUF81 [Desulfarculus baarsii DSM 2075]|uniref:Probable membrane transporter protein n=1 Tax=Desulfarculus baarsii (strain ATCC 33931 / DSM 2075 / LMG 7858 / VKM B-1802 / 2st14) TaxID=644282 RepID=E1QI73_DESB2|nr:sulfite exporter TauE/SafE family protein [Desulfarculus baarsii]ADK85390.1 protein of unknown function DUF81 [Desulfarculus baarsii DSM 2075]